MQHEKLADVVTRIWIVPLVREIVNPIILFLAAGAFVLLLWGIFKFVQNAGVEEARQEGRATIAHGLIGLVIIFGVYGLLNTVLSVFNLPAVQKVSAPAEFAAGNLNPSNNVVVASSTVDELPMVTINIQDLLTAEVLQGLGNNNFSNDAASLTSTALLAANSLGTDCDVPFAPSDLFGSSSNSTLALSFDEIVQQLRGVVMNCENELAAGYIEYPLSTTPQNRWLARFGGPTEASISVMLSTEDRYIKDTIAKGAISPLVGDLYVMHTHPQQTIIKQLQFTNPQPPFSSPPDFADVGVTFFLTLAMMGIDAQLADRIHAYVISPAYLYHMDASPLALKYLADFKNYLAQNSPRPITAKNWTQTASAMRFYFGTLMKKSDFPLSPNYWGSTNSTTFRSVAPDPLVWAAIGIQITKSPW